MDLAVNNQIDTYMSSVRQHLKTDQLVLLSDQNPARFTKKINSWMIAEEASRGMGRHGLDEKNEKNPENFGS
jgi:hypothetical protein